MEETKYTTIYYAIKNKLALSLHEYIVCDMVHCLSNKTDWCYAGKDYIAKNIGITDRGLKNIIDELINKRLLVRKDTTNRYLKTTTKWSKEFGEESSPLPENSSPIPEVISEKGEVISPKGEKSSTYNNIYNNNIIINNIITKFSFLGEDYKRFYKIKTYRDSITRLLEFYNENEIIKRLNYAFEHRYDKFFPQVNNPQDLELKWDKLKVEESKGVDIDGLINKYNK